MKKILITGANGLLAKHFISMYKEEYQIYGTIHRNTDVDFSGIEVLDIDFAKNWNISRTQSAAHFF